MEIFELKALKSISPPKIRTNSSHSPCFLGNDNYLDIIHPNFMGTVVTLSYLSLWKYILVSLAYISPRFVELTICSIHNCIYNTPFCFCGCQITIFILKANDTENEKEEGRNQGQEENPFRVRVRFSSRVRL